MKKLILPLLLLVALLSGCSNADDENYIDLTALSSTVVFAEVYNMMTTPDLYMGKTVKMSGLYYASYYDVTDQFYHYVIVADAVACCQQGIEFIWLGDHPYPESYPADESEVELEGIFSSYNELDATYYYIAVEDIRVL